MSLIQVNSIDVHDGESVSILSTLNLQSVATGSSVNNLGIDVSGNVIIGSSGGSSNISDAIYSVYNNLSAHVSSSSTTSSCSYGVNVFTTVTSTNLATKLPQPVTGKSVKIINKGATILSIFPSNVGGQINNLPIDAPAQIPPDGKPYEFICIENPLPGEWTFGPPEIAYYDSGEITISITSHTGQSGHNPIISAYDATHVGNTKQFHSATWGYNGRNLPEIIENTVGVYDLIFRPNTPWLGISKVKVYSNIVSGGSFLARIYGGGEADYYSLFDGSLINNGPSMAAMLMNFSVNNTISGTFVSGSSPYSSANIGDPGTVWGEKVAGVDGNSDVSFYSGGGTIVGNKSFGNIPYPYSGTYDDSNNEILNGDLVERFWSSYISFQFAPFLGTYNYGTIPDFKFRFVIEYYQ
jgi:hypothetical protein